MAVLAGMMKAFQGATNSDDGAPSGQQAMAAAAAQVMQAFQGGTNNPLAAMGGKPAVDFRELRALMPEQLAGLRRTNSRGQKNGALGLNVSEATGEYGEGDGPRLEVKIVDLAAMGPLGAMAGLGWATSEVDSEGDQGYERTATFNGFKALEKYRTAGKSGSVDLMVANRFKVQIEGTNIEPAQLKAAAESLDLSTLDRIAKRPHVE